MTTMTSMTSTASGAGRLYQQSITIARCFSSAVCATVGAAVATKAKSKRSSSFNRRPTKKCGEKWKKGKKCWSSSKNLAATFMQTPVVRSQRVYPARQLVLMPHHGGGSRTAPSSWQHRSLPRLISLAVERHVVHTRINATCHNCFEQKKVYVYLVLHLWRVCGFGHHVQTADSRKVYMENFVGGKTRYII